MSVAIVQGCSKGIGWALALVRRLNLTQSNGRSRTGFGQALTRALLARTQLQVVGTTASGAGKARNAILGSGGSQEVVDHDVKGPSKGTSKPHLPSLVKNADKAKLIPRSLAPSLNLSFNIYAEPLHEGTGYDGSTSGGYGGADEFGGEPQGNVKQQESPEGNTSEFSTTRPTFGGSKKEQEEWASRLTTLDMDVQDEEAIAHAAKQVKERFGSNEVRLVINVSGVELIVSLGPVLPGMQLHAEKNLSAISSYQLLETFKINTFGHLLVYKHFTPLLPHKKQVDGVEDPARGVLRPGMSGLVSVSARVGSIGDNERGGYVPKRLSRANVHARLNVRISNRGFANGFRWYSYRSSKAALNQIIRTLSHELNRRSPQHPVFCVAYHPGTMRTALSQPYTRGQTPDNTKGLFDVDEAAAKLVKLLNGMTVEKSGEFWAYDGTRVPW